VAVAVGIVFGSAWNHLGRVKSWFDAHPLARVVPVVALALLFRSDLKARRWHLDCDWQGVKGLATDPRIAVAQWLDGHADPNARIIFDYGVYVPLKFKSAHLTWGLVEGQITAIDPHFVLIRDDRRALFKDADAPQPDEKARWYLRERVRALAMLEKHELGGLRFAKRFEDARITLYQSETVAACPKPCMAP
jgi:hypothetical protein